VNLGMRWPDRFIRALQTLRCGILVINEDERDVANAVPWHPRYKRGREGFYVVYAP